MHRIVFGKSMSFRWFADVAPSQDGIVIKLEPFCGVMGVAWEETGEFRTIPPRKNGGNMDVRYLTAGTTLYLPVFVEGALFSAGDGHATQGDGEVCVSDKALCPLGKLVRRPRKPRTDDARREGPLSAFR